MVHRQTFLQPLLRRAPWARLRQFGLGAVLALGTAVPATASAIIQVHNDPGGDLTARMRFVDGLRASKTPVQIGAGYCLGACTLYLGLAQTCVSPDARFGFARSQHAPQGTPADRLRSYYPAVLHPLMADLPSEDQRGFHEVSGRTLIALGVAECGG